MRGEKRDIKLRRLAGVRLVHQLHVMERVLLLFIRLRGNAVAWNVNLQIPHISIICRRKDAAVGTQSGEHKALRSEVLQQNVERRLIKAGMPGLQDEVVVGTGLKPFDETPATLVCLQAGRNGVFETGSPTAEIIVYVDRGDMRFPHATLEQANRLSDVTRVLKQLISARIVEIIDDIHEQQRREAIIRRTTVEVVRHCNGAPHARFQKRTCAFTRNQSWTRVKFGTSSAL